jgi:hypothetical protein
VSAHPRLRASRRWLLGLVAVLALAGEIALGARCSVDVPLGVDPHSDAAGPPTTGDGSTAADATADAGG